MNTVVAEACYKVLFAGNIIHSENTRKAVAVGDNRGIENAVCFLDECSVNYRILGVSPYGLRATVGFVLPRNVFDF